MFTVLQNIRLWHVLCYCNLISIYMEEKAMANNEYVTIDLSKKQVDYEHAKVNEKNGKEYVRIMGPEGGSFFYPSASLKENKDNPNRVHFSRPVGTEITLSFSERKPDVPDDAPAEEKYVNTTKVVKIEDLKEMYKQARAAYAENTPFVNVTVPTAWGREFEGKAEKEGEEAARKYVSISIPIREEAETNYWDFVLPAESFKASSKEADMSYFGFPRKKMDSDEPYMVTLRRSVKDENGVYSNIEMQMSSADLVDAIKAAKGMQQEKLEIEVSEKLLRKFNSHDGKALVSLSVPIFDENLGMDTFYNIVLPESRVSDGEKEGTKKISVTKDFEFTAKRGVKDESTGAYNDITKQMTGEEIGRAFAESKARFAEQMANEEIRNDRAAAKDQQEASRPHRHGGR